MVLMESIVLRNGFARYLELDGSQGRLTPERDRIEYGIYMMKKPLTRAVFSTLGDVKTAY